MSLVQCPDCGKEFSDTAKTCPNCGFKEKNKINLHKIIPVLVFVAMIVGFGLYLYISSSPVSKYGERAVKDGKAAIFIADQYLDGKITNMECKIQLSVYEKDVIGDFDIYPKITLMKLFSTDADLLRVRNELAKLLRLPER